MPDLEDMFQIKAVSRYPEVSSTHVSYCEDILISSRAILTHPEKYGQTKPWRKDIWSKKKISMKADNFMMSQGVEEDENKLISVYTLLVFPLQLHHSICLMCISLAFLNYHVWTARESRIIASDPRCGWGGRYCYDVLRSSSCHYWGSMAREPSIDRASFWIFPSSVSAGGDTELALWQAWGTVEPSKKKNLMKWRPEKEKHPACWVWAMKGAPWSSEVAVAVAKSNTFDRIPQSDWWDPHPRLLTQGSLDPLSAVDTAWTCSLRTIPGVSAAVLLQQNNENKSYSAQYHPSTSCGRSLYLPQTRWKHKRWILLIILNHSTF